MKTKIIAPTVLLLLLIVGVYAGAKLISEPVKVTPYAAGPACPKSVEWKCEISPEDVSKLTHYSFKLLIYNGSQLVKEGQTNETRVVFDADMESTYTCKLLVLISEEGEEWVECDFLSGRMRCELPEATPIPPDTQKQNEIKSQSQCSQGDGDVNDDGNVDTADINNFVRNQFGNEESEQNDLNCDGRVDLQDWATLFNRVVRR